jgi:hypothetical protein
VQLFVSLPFHELDQSAAKLAIDRIGQVEGEKE